MPIQLKISIDKKVPPPPLATFTPKSLTASVGDQIFWTNYDTVAHWPGLLQSNGSIDKTFFMPNQIAANVNLPAPDSSPIFSSGAAFTFKYACSIHPDEQGEIVVS
jgi:plastocyanin